MAEIGGRSERRKGGEKEREKKRRKKENATYDAHFRSCSDFIRSLSPAPIAETFCLKLGTLHAVMQTP